jgi:hypothetical protein
MSVLEDIYALVDKIGEKLVSIGLVQWKTKLDDAVQGGATSGEILMAVRWHLKELKKDKPGLPSDLGYAIDVVIQLVDQSGVKVGNTGRI